MDLFQFDINELHFYLNQQQERKKEQEITEALEVVKRSYEDNMKYSSSVEYYLRLKVEYHKVILGDLAKYYPILDPEKWECKFVTTDSLGKKRKDILDCELFITVQFKVITCYPNWSVHLPKMSYDLQYHTNQKRYPLEAYALRNIDFYVWFYWCKLSDTWKKIYILKDPKVLTPEIMLLKGNNTNPDFGNIKVEKPGKDSTKRTVQLNPDNELFRKNLIAELDNLDYELLQ